MSVCEKCGGDKQVATSAISGLNVRLTASKAVVKEVQKQLEEAQNKEAKLADEVEYLTEELDSHREMLMEVTKMGPSAIARMMAHVDPAGTYRKRKKRSVVVPIPGRRSAGFAHSG